MKQRRRGKGRMGRTLPPRGVAGAVGEGCRGAHPYAGARMAL